MSQWHKAIAYALTGTVLELADEGVLDCDQLLAQLATSGWNDAAIARVKQERLAAQLPWPFPVPEQLRYGCGFAQLSAGIAAAEDKLGLRASQQAATLTRALTDAEQRLLADLPPHFGRI